MGSLASFPYRLNFCSKVALCLITVELSLIHLLKMGLVKDQDVQQLNLHQQAEIRSSCHLPTEVQYLLPENLNTS